MKNSLLIEIQTALENGDVNRALVLLYEIKDNVDSDFDLFASCARKAHKLLNKRRIREMLGYLEQQGPNTVLPAEQERRRNTIVVEAELLRLAINWYTAAIEKNPKTPAWHNELGELYLSFRLFAEAEQCFKASLAIEPDYVEARYNLGRCYDIALDRKKAIAAHLDLIKDHPDFGKAYADVATLSERLLKDEDLETYALKAQTLAPDYLNTHYVRFLLEKKNGRLKAAHESLSKVIELSDNQTFFMFQMGLLLEKMAEYKKAYHWFEKANYLSDPRIASAEGFLAEHEALMDVLAQIKQNEEITAPGVQKNGPVFIMGTIRSGTTLLSEMLGKHSAITNIGESGLMDFICDAGFKALEMPSDLTLLYDELWLKDNQALVDDLRAQLTAIIAKNFPQAQNKIFVDKTPTNTSYMGVIAKLLPDARFIVLLRDPREASLSAFKQSFFGHHWQKYNPRDYMLFWAKTQELVASCCEVFELSALTVRYEKLVKAPRDELKRIFDFLHLDLEPACLEFYEGNDVAGTVSYRQVKNPIYTSSIDFNKKAYPDAHKELTVLARDTLEKYGYE